MCCVPTKLKVMGIAVLAAAVLFAVSCGGKRSGGTEAAGAEAGSGSTTSVVAGSADVALMPRFLPPTLPPMLTEEASVEFVARHWWDNLDYSDPAWIADTVMLESAFGVWAQALKALPEASAVPLAGELISRGETTPAMQLRLLDVMEYFWHHPNSPFRDEYLFEAALEAVVSAPAIDETAKLRPQTMLSAVRKNRPGSVASDISFTTGSGRRGTVHAIEADYLLIMFYEPGCPECARFEQHIPRSEQLSPLLASGRLKVVALYPGVDVEAWRAHLPQMPAGWTVGHASLFESGAAAYDLPGIPSLYLLDRHKRVLLKDAMYEDVEEWFSSHAAELAAGATPAAAPIAAAVATPAADCVPAADSDLAAGTASDLASVSASDAAPASADGDAAPALAGCMWDRTSHDFGEVPLGESVATRFTLRADGTVVVVLSATPDCACTQADIPRRPLRAGEQGAIAVRFDAQERGDFHKTIRVLLNIGGAERSTALTISGTVK